MNDRASPPRSALKQVSSFGDRLKNDQNIPKPIVSIQNVDANSPTLGNTEAGKGKDPRNTHQEESPTKRRVVFEQQ